MEKEKVFAQHEENVESLKKLEFYKEEIEIFKGRLEEIADKNSSFDCLSSLERYQNQLIIQRNNIDEIRHVVKQDENRIEQEIESNPIAVDHRSIAYHATEIEAVTSFEKNFNDLRQEMNLFFAKWM
jgi:hypothetical protein